MVILQEQNRHL